MILFAACLELKISTLASLTNGQKTVTALKLEQTLTSFHSLQFESLMQGIILAWSLLILATWQDILLQWCLILSEFKVSSSMHIAHG